MLKYSCGTKLIVTKQHEDKASRLIIGDIVELCMDLYIYDDIVNIGGAHYLVEDLDKYFTLIE